MATWDNADLLARFKLHALRPANDQQITDAQIYQLLSDAQFDYYGIFAVHCPWVLLSAPAAMSTADSGVTYTFTGSARPLYVEIFDSATGRLLIPTAYWDAAGDYVWEGDNIRMARGRSRSFTPYARIIAPPTVIDGSTQPTLVPDYARILLVYRAVAQWALRGGLRDPKPFEEMEYKKAWGDMQTGEVGIIPSLKSANPFLGQTAIPAVPDDTLTQLYTIDSGYQAL